MKSAFVRCGALLGCLLALSVFADFDPDAADAWLKEAYPADEPGVTVIAVKDGEVVFKGAYGMANLELGVPLAPDMVLRLGSITKQFTATAIMMLEQEGKLSVSDDVTKHLPGYNTHGHTITIEHLLTHTSGIPNYTDQPGWMDEVRYEATQERMFGVWQDLPLDFEPGEQYKYSNSGYWMLGAIVEAASGMSYQDFVEERIFKPLGMNSSYHDRQARLIPRRASGYWHDRENQQSNAPFVDMSNPGAAGALVSSVEDLATWDAALYTETLLPAEAWQRMWTPYTLNSGEKSWYGYGWSLGEHDGAPVINHDGAIHGFNSSAFRLPDQRMYVAVLSNGAHAGARGTSQRLAKQVLGIEDAEAVIDMGLDALKEYEGVFRIGEHGERTAEAVEEGLLTRRNGGPAFLAQPVGNDRFRYPGGGHLVYHRDADGHITGHEIQDFGGAPNFAERTGDLVKEVREIVPIDPAELDDYAGDYELMPGFVLKVWGEEGELRAQATGQNAFSMDHNGNDVFFNALIGAEIVFHRGDDGVVTGLTLNQGGQSIDAGREATATD